MSENDFFVAIQSVMDSYLDSKLLHPDKVYYLTIEAAEEWVDVKTEEFDDF